MKCYKVMLQMHDDGNGFPTHRYVLVFANTKTEALIKVLENIQNDTVFTLRAIEIDNISGWNGNFGLS